MNPRQPIKTTAKKIGSAQKKIGRNPNRTVVDVRPYGGYTALAHKTEAGSHIEQNYSVNVQNQLQLMKKISESTTLNTSHMHMQLGQLEKELKEWERKVAKGVKKKDKPLIDTAPSVFSQFDQPIVHIQKLYKNVFNEQSGELSQKPIKQRIKSIEGRFNHYGQLKVNSAHFWVEKLQDRYKVLSELENITHGESSQWQADFLHHIKTLETSVNPLLSLSWQRESSQLIERLVQELEKVDQPVVTSKNFYKALKKETILTESSLDNLRSYYKSKEKHSTHQWSDKEKEFVSQLNLILEALVTEERNQQVEKAYRELYQETSASEKAYEQLEAYYKTFEQNHWMKTLIMAESPLMDEDMHKGVSLLYDYLKFLSSNTNNLKKKATVTTLYDLLYGMITATIDKQEKEVKLDQLIKEQANLFGSNNTVNTMKSFSKENINHLLKYLFVVNQWENFSTRDITEVVSLLETAETYDLNTISEGNERLEGIASAGYSEINSEKESDLINTVALKTEYEMFCQEVTQSIEKTLQWMEQVFSIKEILVEQALSKTRLDVERHFHDLIEIEERSYTGVNSKETYDYLSEQTIDRQHPQEKVNRWQQWFEDITENYGQNGLSVFKVKQFFNQNTLTYNHPEMADEFVKNQFSTLSKYVDTLSQELKFLSETVTLKEAYESTDVQQTLKNIGGVIDQLIAYDKTHYQRVTLNNEAGVQSFIEDKMIALRQSIGGEHLIYKEGLVEGIDHQKQLLETLMRRVEKNQFEKENISESYLQRQIKETQNKISAKHLAFSSKLLINPEDMQVYYMTNGNTMRYAATALSYEEVMNQVQATALSGFNQIHKEIQTQVKNELTGDSVQNSLNQSTAYTAKHIHQMIQKLSQNLQQILGHDSHILNQQQLMTYSQLLFGENGVEAVTEKLVGFVEKQYLKTLGLDSSSITAYMNSSNRQIKRNQLSQSSQAYINHVDRNSWLNHQWLSPWSISLLKFNQYRNKAASRAYSTAYSRAYTMAYPMAYLVPYTQTNRGADAHHYAADNRVQRMFSQSLKHQKWAEWILNRGKVFRDYAYAGIDQLYNKLVKSETFLNSGSVNDWAHALESTVLQEYGQSKELRTILDQAVTTAVTKLVTEVVQNDHKANIYGSALAYYENPGISEIMKAGMMENNHLNSDKGNRQDNHLLSSNQMVHRGQENSQSIQNENDLSKHTNIYNDTLIAYTTEVVEASSDVLSKELLIQKELIEVLQSELAVLKEEKQIEQINIDKLSDSLLKELSHRIRKDRQRKGWI